MLCLEFHCYFSSVALYVILLLILSSAHLKSRGYHADKQASGPSFSSSFTKWTADKWAMMCNKKFVLTIYKEYSEF